MRACVRQVFPLQKDPGAARFLREAPGLGDGRRPARVVVQQGVELLMEGGVIACSEVCPFERLNRLNERLGHVSSAELAKVSPGVGVPPRRCNHCRAVSPHD